MRQRQAPPILLVQWTRFLLHRVVVVVVAAVVVLLDGSHSCRAWSPVQELYRPPASLRRPGPAVGGQSTSTSTRGTKTHRATLPNPSSSSASSSRMTLLWSAHENHSPLPWNDACTAENKNGTHSSSSLWRRAFGRFDAITSAGYDRTAAANDETNGVLTAGSSSSRSGQLFGTIKKLHNPITYFVLGILAGFKWDWCFKSPLYWFAIGFTIKWYRARYVFKIPVWDRQPNWNNIITNREQEKDLKAYTCKKCGATIFIAKTREFFFEGNTGFGGLGCFSCGAKGKENFVMDRDRIVEDVGDMDDYFEYERPLDFVSRAERRKLLKEAQGDEERANQILLNRAVAGETTTTVVDVKPPNNDGSPPDFVEAILEAESPTGRTEEEEIEPEPELDLVDEELADEIERKASAELSQQLRGDNEKDLEMKPAADLAPVSPSQPEVAIEPIKKRTKSPKTSQPNASSSSSSKKKSVLDLDGLDELDMDAW